jgi:predicted ATP-grasp superfamily ATP-dependent carboligase
MMSMNLLLIETVTGGAFDRPPYATLLPEAEAMLGAMVAEVTARPAGASLALATRVLRHHSLRAPWARCGETPIECVVVPDGDWSRVWRGALVWADAVWLVAPETGGELETLSRAVEAAGRRLLGCAADGVAVAGSKSATHAALTGSVLLAEPLWQGVEDVSPPGTAAAAVPSLAMAGYSTAQQGTVSSVSGWWVIKPNDGVSAEGVRRVPELPVVPPGCVVQPYVDGEPLSLCVLSDGREVRVLAVNRQHIEWHSDGRAQYLGGVTNALPDRDHFAPLARAVQAAIPGLWGYWGIDCVLPADARPVLIEVNPRLTTTFAHLREAIGVDLLGALFEIAGGGALPDAPVGHAVPFALTSGGPRHACVGQK